MIEFKFPDIGEGISEGVVLKWLVDVGQQVKEGDSLFLVETDKVNAEIPSPADGVILARMAKEGDTINVGQVIVKIGDGQDPPANTGPVEIEENAGVVGSLEASSHVIAESSEHAGVEVASRNKVLATPVARKLAKDLGVDINTISGSGPVGRVMKEDILAKANALRGKLEPTKTPVPVAQQVTQVAIPEPVENVGAGKSSQGEPSTGLVVRVPLTTLGKTIARNMILSKSEIPHASVMNEIDVTELVKLRAEAKSMAEDQDIKLTYLPFIIKAVTLTLKEFPVFNASFDKEAQETLFKRFYNIGIAVDTSDGLLVPVIKNADRLGILGLGKELQGLTDRARTRTLTLDDLQNGTFTVTNYGAVGASFGVPVIKYPEVAILGIGAITKKPVVNQADEIVIRQMMPLTLSFDHRIIDGGNAGRFLKTLSLYLQEPMRLLLG